MAVMQSECASGAERRMTAFSRYIGIDYSGAESAESSLKGLGRLGGRQPDRN
jgi:hypothetical protein